MLIHNATDASRLQLGLEKEEEYVEQMKIYLWLCCIDIDNFIKLAIMSPRVLNSTRPAH